MGVRWLLRLLFVTGATAFALMAYDAVAGEGAWDPQIAMLYAAVAAVTSAGIVFFEARFQRELARGIVAAAFGLAAGIVVSCFTIAIVVVFVLPTEGSVPAAFERIQIYVPLIMTAFCYMGVTLVLQTRNDFRFLVPYIDFSHRGQEEGGFILDTSAIIDGRILDICSTNIISRPLTIPDFVLRELQMIADSADRLRRKRGRRGLDVVSALQKGEHTRILLLETDVPERCEVDMELVVLAKRVNGRIITNDFNLNKVAQIEGVKVMNINDLANALKPVVLPGEGLSVMVLRPGEEPGQGVGYLDDGTMVVVEQGRNHINKTVDIVITGSIQTSAGRMVFGKLNDGGLSKP
ncbi:MAG: PIN/TRAM domain-containing protein [Planctomycetota bacterium]